MVRLSHGSSHLKFDVSSFSRYKSQVWYLGRRFESATAPQLYSLRTEFDLRHWTNVWEGCSGSTKRKSGDRPDANPKAYSTSMGESESVLTICPQPASESCL